MALMLKQKQKKNKKPHTLKFCDPEQVQYT